VTERTTVACRVAEVRVAHGVYGECLLFRVRHVGDESLAPKRYMLPCSRRGFRETSELLLDSLAQDLVAEVTVEEGRRKTWPLMVVSVALMRGDNHGEVRKQYIHDWSKEPDRPPLRWLRASSLRRRSGIPPNFHATGKVGFGALRAIQGRYLNSRAGSTAPFRGGPVNVGL
jgi:hypothetical protein